jgi:carbonic anhydrase/acetyltransferase-like protein (isoleucine patch superfamily)
MIHNFEEKKPIISENCYAAESADIIGDIVLNEDSSVWFGAVLRGDMDRIIVGKGSNIQDNCTVHVDKGQPVEIGENVTIGHNSVIHGCKIGSNSLIGMGTIVLDGAEVGENTIVGAGSLVTGGKKIPSGVLCLGSPVKIIRELTEEEIASIKQSAEHYIEISKSYIYR